MQDITLDFTGCKYLYGVHMIFKEAFNFPEWYGMNLDALWDCLRDYCGANRCIYVCGMNYLFKEFGWYAEKILEILERVHSENPTVVFEIVS